MPETGDYIVFARAFHVTQKSPLDPIKFYNIFIYFLISYSTADQRVKLAKVAPVTLHLRGKSCRNRVTFLTAGWDNASLPIFALSLSHRNVSSLIYSRYTCIYHEKSLRYNVKR